MAVAEALSGRITLSAGMRSVEMVRRACRAFIAALVVVGSVSGVVTAAPPPGVTAAPAATAVSASFVTNPINYGATGTLRGSLVLRSNDRGIANQRVALFGRAVGSTSWQDMARSAETAADGRYRVPHSRSHIDTRLPGAFPREHDVWRVDVGGEDTAGAGTARRRGDGTGQCDGHRGHDTDMAGHDQSLPRRHVRRSPGQGGRHVA